MRRERVGQTPITMPIEVVKGVGVPTGKSADQGVALKSSQVVDGAAVSAAPIHPLTKMPEAPGVVNLSLEVTASASAQQRETGQRKPQDFAAGRDDTNNPAYATGEIAMQLDQSVELGAVAGSPPAPPDKPPGGGGGASYEQEPEDNGEGNDGINRRRKDAYSDEEKEAIRATAVRLLDTDPQEWEQDEAFVQAAPGRAMGDSFVFTHDDNTYIALVPHTRTRDLDKKEYERRKNALDPLTQSNRPLPKEVEHPVTHDDNRLMIINEYAPGVAPEDMSTEEIHAIKDHHIAEALHAVDFFHSLGRQIDSITGSNIHYDPTVGFGIFDVYVPLGELEPLDVQYSSFLWGIVQQKEYTGDEARDARIELRQRVEEAVTRHIAEQENAAEHGTEENADEEIEAISDTAIDLLHTAHELRSQHPSFVGEIDDSQIAGSFIFSHGDETFIALVPDSTKDEGQRMDAYFDHLGAVERLRAVEDDQQIPAQLPQTVAYIEEERLIINKLPSGKFSQDLTPDEINAIPTRHLEDMLIAIEYLQAHDLTIPDGLGQKFMYDPESGFSILEISVPVGGGDSVEEQYESFLRSVTRLEELNTEGVYAREALFQQGVDILQGYVARQLEANLRAQAKRDAMLDPVREEDEVYSSLLSGRGENAIEIGPSSPSGKFNGERRFEFQDSVKQFRQVFAKALQKVPSENYSDAFRSIVEVNGQRVELSSYFTNLDLSFIQQQEAGETTIPELHKKAFLEDWGTIKVKFECPPGEVDQQGREISSYSYLFAVPKELIYLQQDLAILLGVSQDTILAAEDELGALLRRKDKWAGLLDRKDEMRTYLMRNRKPEAVLAPENILGALFNAKEDLTDPERPDIIYLTPTLMRDALGIQDVDLDTPVVLATTDFVDESIPSEIEVLTADSPPHHVDRLEAAAIHISSI